MLEVEEHERCSSRAYCASLLKNVEKKSHFFLRSEPGTSASLLKNVEKKSHFFFGALNLKQVLAY